MPRAPHRCPTAGCREVLPAGTKHCEAHKPQAWSGGMNAHQGHGTTRWQRKLVAQVLREEPVCQDCAQERSTEAGHIVPKSQGGKFVRANLKGQCRPCNLRQMRADRNLASARGLAVDRGLSVDPPAQAYTGGAVEVGPTAARPPHVRSTSPAHTHAQVHSTAHTQDEDEVCDVVIGTTYTGGMW